LRRRAAHIHPDPTRKLAKVHNPELFAQICKQVIASHLLLHARECRKLDRNVRRFHGIEGILVLHLSGQHDQESFEIAGKCAFGVPRRDARLGGRRGGKRRGDWFHCLNP
jgi:hypothetical protein